MQAINGQLYELLDSYGDPTQIQIKAIDAELITILHVVLRQIHALNYRPFVAELG